MRESDKGEQGTQNAQGAESAETAATAKDRPEADALQRMMKERFGDAKFGSLMNSIVDEMFKNMAEVKDKPGGPWESKKTN